MNKPIVGQQTFENTSTQFPTVTVDGDNSSIQLGGKGSGLAFPGQPIPAYNGNVTIANNQGYENVRIGAAASGGGNLALNNEKGQYGTVLSFEGLRMGGNGVYGEVELYAADAPNAPGTDAPFQPGLRIGPGYAKIGGGVDSGNGQIGLFTQGIDTSLVFGSDSFSSATIHLRASDATVRSGGAGQNGRIWVLEKGDKGQIKITADDTLGGKMQVFNKAGAETIKLDGATGNIEVTGDITLTNADCAEDFDLAGLERIEPGTVVVLEDDGKVCQSMDAYDSRVAGVVSGAGNFRPGIILDKQSHVNRVPIALVGKVYCKVDASHGSINVGDLLTTSPIPGHAMKAGDRVKAFGAVLGKALRSLNSGQDLIPILIALQ